MKISAIPTMYKGIQFRSQLEAQWAYCLDRHSYSEMRNWRYEAFPLEGYIPDFFFPDTGRMFIEIKPVWNETEAASFLSQLKKRFPKTSIDLGGFDGKGYMLNDNACPDGGAFCMGSPFPYEIWKEAQNFFQWRRRQ